MSLLRSKARGVLARKAVPYHDIRQTVCPPTCWRQPLWLNRSGSRFPSSRCFPAVINSRCLSTFSSSAPTLAPSGRKKANTSSSISATAASSASTSVQQNQRPHTVLVDGSYLIFRSHYSPFKTTLLNPNGVPVNALFVFTRTLIKLLSQLKADYLGVFGDQGPSFRQQIFAEYKAHRAETPPELVQQFPLIDDAMKAFAVSSLRMAGIEADDLIATYTKEAAKDGHKVTIISKDKDLLQLVNDDVTVYDPFTDTYMDEQAVVTKFGVPPSRIADLLALTGDKSDNIPGVPGIGPKTAAALLNSYGNLDSIIANPGIIKEAAKRKKIIENLQKLQQSMELVRLKDDVDVPLSLEAFKYKPAEREPLSKFLTEHNFRSIMNQLDKICGSPPSVASMTTIATKGTRGRPKLAEAMQVSEVNAPTPMSATNISNLQVDKVTIVNNIADARKVVEKLRSPGIRERYHACDTETVDIDPKEESPYGHGRIICASIYCGSDVDFGNGPRIWIDNLVGPDGDAVITAFKDYFEDEGIKKVWHNYSFDRAMLFNHKIVVKGFGGDTMHMARLWDSARTNSGGYSLEALTRDVLAEDADDMYKRTIKDLFGRSKTKKDGTPGKEIIVPPLDVIQRGEDGEESLRKWVEYSTYDTEGTWLLRQELEKKLKKMEWRYVGQKLSPSQKPTMWDYYLQYWLPFGELLTDMEREGIRVDVQHLKDIEVVARQDADKAIEAFRHWAEQQCGPDGFYMNPLSDAQKQQLFFAGAQNSKRPQECLPLQREFKIENKEGFIEPGQTKPKKQITIEIRGLEMKPLAYTASGWPAVGSEVLEKMAGNPFADPPSYGTAYSEMGGGEAGEAACRAIAQLVEASKINTLLNTFIVPLQTQVDEQSRIHASLNINTETGRLSCRRPNLQNQPALEKDRYKIRKAFTCRPGNSLVVADYGQLELRVLAHMTNCRSMIEAFQKGGDFHSRTAMGMYSYIQDAIKKGDVLLEWDYKKNDGKKPPVPLLKDKYAMERRRAKVLNFSIAYGKTAHGLAKDWNVSIEEAKETLARWYSDRPEVKKWQEDTIANAKKYAFTRTLMGRFRPLPEIRSQDMRMRAHSERAAINTPIQGGAADIVLAAMILTHQDELLRDMGWTMILQVHDELILEGPKETAEKALARLKQIMSHPFPEPLLVDLSVDGNVGQTWFESK